MSKRQYEICLDGIPECDRETMAIILLNAGYSIYYGQGDDEFCVELVDKHVTEMMIDTEIIRRPHGD